MRAAAVQGTAEHSTTAAAAEQELLNTQQLLLLLLLYRELLINSPQGVSLHNVFLVSALLFFPSPHKFSSGMSSANQCFYCEVRWNKKTPFTVKF